ncbi:MAG TPA: hypothetical protein PKI66_04040 [Methanobacteriaceae archaeon]|nr:hypothetical protein [Euryarchaeota archaeon]HNR25870.1 hypothetical protein [Methanobacteriaceae archaeon]HNS25774.1 hypothetical protein [Methanobacteriaceae archaeon]
MKKKRIRSHTPVTCQCQPPAVERPPSILRSVQCPDCGKFFRTNRQVDHCFKCRP